MKPQSAGAAALSFALPWIRHLGFGLFLIVNGCGTDADGRRPAPLDASSVRTIYPSESLCHDCIRLEQIAKMGEREGPGFLTGPMYATRDRLGRFWVEHTGSVKVFDQRGAFLRDVGRSGQGPNEFGRAWPMFTDEKGRVHVFDVSNGRISLFDSEFTLVEERRLPGIIHDAALIDDGDQYAASMWLQTADRIGAPLHILTADGELLNSFGASEGSPPIDGNSAARLLAVNLRGNVVSVVPYKHEIEVWDRDGNRIAAYVLPDFNVTPILTGAITRDNPYPNTVMGLRMDKDDRLWVLSWIRKPDWLDSMEEARRPDGQLVLRRRPGTDLASVFSSRIDVLDLQTGAIIARSEQEELIVRFLDDSSVWAPGWEGDGTPFVSAWRLSLVTDGRSEGD